jgi:signal transduction histidine kinase
MPETKKRKSEAESGKLQFTVDAGLLFQLGEQLVARRSVALAELIKNAYDADSTKVTVLLENVTSENGTIIVEDNGTGMTFEQIRDHWMRIATDDKLRNPISPIYSRPRTGAKGIGRFATRRLANTLILHSVAQREDGTKEKTVVEFDWKRIFRSGQTLTEIPVYYERTPVESDTLTGVMLYLEDARDVWTEQDILDLQKDLFTLTSPFPQDAVPDGSSEEISRDPGFGIDWEIPEFPEYAGESGEQYLAAAWGVLVGNIDDQGAPHYRFAIRTPEEKLDFAPDGEVFSYLANARFTIHYFVFKSPYFDDSPLGVRDAQRIGRDQGGVRVYLDGFRVFPYGDPGDDWLELDIAKAGRTRRLIQPTAELQEMENIIPGRPVLLLPGNNQLFGAITLSRLKHPKIEANISRERLVENEAFSQLRRFVQLGIYWMTIQYARVTVEEREQKKQTGLPSALALVSQAWTIVQASQDIPPETQNELLHILDYAQERAQAEQEEFIGELSMLRALSSLGAMIAIFNHQLRATIDGIRAIHTDLLELRPRASSKLRPNLDKILDQVQNWREMLKHQVSQLESVLGKSRRERRRRVPLRKVVDNVANPLSLYRDDFGIGFKNQVPSNLRTPPIFEAELHAILLHIFTNALKAVRDKDVREIAVKAMKQEDELHIFMLDTGGGVDPARREVVFRPFETTSTPDPILGEGTGLGLKVVRDILETYGGTAHFIDADQFTKDAQQWHTCIEIVLPERK